MAKRLALLGLLLLLTTAGAVGQTERKKRPLPPVEKRTEQVRQTGLSQPPEPAPERATPALFDSSSRSYHSIGEFPTEGSIPESYTPQPLCQPAVLVPTTGLGPSMAPPTAGTPYWR